MKLRPVTSLALLLAAGSLGLAGCSDDGASPVRPEAAVASVQPGATDQHLVLFEDFSVPAEFPARVAALGGTVDYTHAAGIALVGGLTDGAAAQLEASGGIIDVRRDEVYAAAELPQDPPVEAAAEGASANAPAGARHFALQWHMRAIGADRAWAAGRLGSSGVTVAILDTGLDYTHPDLAGRVDLSRSVSFVPSDDRLVAASFPGSHPVADLHYHGTHVGAIVSSNAVLAAGVTSRVTLMGVKVLSANNAGPYSAILQGVLYAVDSGADVINMSIVGGFAKTGGGEFLGYLNRVFTAANRRGVTVVVAAGNDNLDMDHDGNRYVAFCSAPNVICVSATGPSAADGLGGPFHDVDARAPYSNYGRSAVSVAAPGGAVGLVWAACSRTSLVLPGCRTGPIVVGLYGTSMAAPHVSGLAALLVERYGRSPSRIRTHIEQTADDLGAVGTDPVYGKGRVSVPRALGL